MFNYQFIYKDILANNIEIALKVHYFIKYFIILILIASKY